MSKNKNLKGLFICTISPLQTNIKSGGVNLTRSNYNALSELSHIDLLNTLRGPASKLSKIIRFCFALCGDLAGNTFWFRLKLKRQLHTNHYDFIFIDHSQLGNLAPLIRKKAPSSLVIGAFQNIESEYIQAAMNLPIFFILILKKAAFQNEKILVQSAHHLLCLSEEDSHQLFQLYGKKADLIIPITTKSTDDNIISDISANTITQPPPSPFLLFCGSYFKPNIEALQWFTNQVLDYIPYPLVVIGYQMENLKKQLTHPKLMIQGTVTDTAPYYHAALAVINPVTLGAGMNSKSIEAIEYGKILFTTSFAIRGFPQPLPEGITTCNTPNEFVQKIKETPLSQQPLHSLIKYHKTNFSLEKRMTLLSLIIKP